MYIEFNLINEFDYNLYILISAFLIHVVLVLTLSNYTFIVNIIALSHGICIGWLSPVLPLLQSDESPLRTGPLTVDQTAVIGLLYCVGALIGTFVFIYISHRYGSKFALNLLAYPQIGFWLIVIFGDSYHYLYFGRILKGITGGGVFSCIPMFIADIAEPKLVSYILILKYLFIT